jgi:DNA-binding GntR family transcriptional regulator
MSIYLTRVRVSKITTIVIFKRVRVGDKKPIFTLDTYLDIDRVKYFLSLELDLKSI